ncbi:MAG: hypothetical protein ACLTXM_16625, partial [Enterococcus sp.]
LTYIFDGPFPTFYRGPLHSDFECIDFTNVWSLWDLSRTYVRRICIVDTAVDCLVFDFFKAIPRRHAIYIKVRG